MQAFKTTGVAKFGPGEMLGLSDDQIAPRKRSVEVVSKQEGGAIVKAIGALEFMAGEIIGLEELPPRLATVAEAIDAVAGAPARPRKGREAA